jgi:hypothetical protein
MAQGMRLLAESVAKTAVEQNRPLTKGEEAEIARLLTAADDAEEDDAAQADPVTSRELARAKAFAADVRTKAVTPERDDDGGGLVGTGPSAADVEYAREMKALRDAHNAGTLPPIPPERLAEQNRLIDEIEHVDEQLEGTVERRDRQRLHRKRDALTDELGATVGTSKF